jgi:hypothetical protein
LYIVALTELRTPIEVEAQRLAEDLGTTAYELRIQLTAGMPAVVVTTADKEHAQRILGRILERGNLAVGCDDDYIVDSERMVTMKRFRMDADGLRTEEAPAEFLPYGDVLAIVRATHRLASSSRTVTKERSFSAGRAILSGGLVVTKSSTREDKKTTDEREHVVYLFRRSGERPWIMRQDEAKYHTLGPSMQPTNALNFPLAVTRLRELAPTATFDTRLVSVKRIPERNVTLAVSQVGVTVSSFTYGVDLLAHLLAMHLKQQDTASPYRR